MHRAAWLVALALPSVARAEATVDVELSPQGTALATELGVTADQLAAQIEDAIDDAYRTNDIAGFLRDFTDATSFSARGLGVDYASVPRDVVAGVALNLAAAGSSNVRSEDVPTAGLAANLAVMIGMNLREWKHPRWTVFADGFYRNAATEDLEGNILTLGAHVQYRVMQPIEDTGTAGALGWIGLSVTTGLELTRWKLGAPGEKLATDFGVAGAAAAAELLYDATGRFDLSSRSVTIPIEATTGFRIALLASVYGGVGLDLATGASTVDANLAGQLRTLDNRDVGTVTIAADGREDGSPVMVRVPAGIQANLWKLFVQANASASQAASIGLGLRFVQ
jgi:hypothetical protein